MLPTPWLQERSARRNRINDWHHERVKYGKTLQGKQYVDPDQLDKLEGLGYDRKLAAEALRKNENQGQVGDCALLLLVVAVRVE